MDPAEYKHIALGLIFLKYIYISDVFQMAKAAVQENPRHLQKVKTALVGVLAFLCSSEGRTDADRQAVDPFLLLAPEQDMDRSDLPGPHREVLFAMGGQLHDTFSAPAVAENFSARRSNYWHGRNRSEHNVGRPDRALRRTRVQPICRVQRVHLARRSDAVFLVKPFQAALGAKFGSKGLPDLSTP
jgi:hypothetical protein